MIKSMHPDASMVDEVGELGNGRKVNMAAGRRAFLRHVGAATAAGAVAGTLGGTTPAAAQAANYDVQILNFALNLEYLEAEFYLNAYYGTGLAASDITGIGTPGAVSGGGQVVPFQDTLVKAYANEIAQDEKSHVQFLRAVLGSAAVARPTIDIGVAFTTAARAANLIGPQDTFNPYADDNSFLLGAYIFEDVGVTAYHGAAPLVTNKQILDYAAGILAVEAYHAGIVRTTLFAKGLYAATGFISRLRYYLDGTGSDDQGIGSDQSTVDTGAPQTLSNIVPTDFTGRVYSRTPKQVLSIVYGNQAATPGLFFPNGVNPGPGASIAG